MGKYFRNLPRVSYVKAIDVWMLGSMSFIFCSSVLFSQSNTEFSPFSKKVSWNWPLLASKCARRMAVEFAAQRKYRHFCAKGERRMAATCPPNSAALECSKAASGDSCFREHSIVNILPPATIVCQSLIRVNNEFVVSASPNGVFRRLSPTLPFPSLSRLLMPITDVSPDTIDQVGQAQILLYIL
jgi:hypothetical protein